MPPKASFSNSGSVVAPSGPGHRCRYVAKGLALPVASRAATGRSARRRRRPHSCHSPRPSSIIHGSGAFSRSDAGCGSSGTGVGSASTARSGVCGGVAQTGSPRSIFTLACPVDRSGDRSAVAAIPSSAATRSPVAVSRCSRRAFASSVTSSARCRARLISSRVEDWRANVRVRWWFRRFRFGPQSGSLGHVSSPRSSNRACGFPAHGSRTRSCLRPRKAARSRSKASEAHVIEQPLVREAQQFSGPHLVLAAQPLA